MISDEKILKIHKPIRTRIIACILVIAMILPMVPAISLPVSAESDATEPSYSNYTAISIAEYGQTHQLVIYSFSGYKNSNGEIKNGGGYGFTLSQTNNDVNFSITVGDNPITNEPATEVTNSDINIQLSGMETTGNFTIKQVNSGNNKVNIYAASGATSIIGTLAVEAGAKLELNVFGELYIDSLVLGEGSQVIVSVQGGGKLDISELSGEGALNAENGAGELYIGEGDVGTFTANGAKIKVATSLHADTLSLNNAAIESSSADAKASVTSVNDIVVTGSSVKNLALFGYSSAATGIHNITLSSGINGVVIEGVDCFGVDETANAKIKINGYSNIASTNANDTHFVSDFDITYYHNETDISNEYNIVAYRAKYSGFGADVEKICGTIQSDLTIQSGITTLPTFAEDGYTFHGWSIDNSSEFYFALANDEGDSNVPKAKDITLTTAVIAGEVNVVFDHGFVPDNYSHECTNGKTWSVSGADVKVGASVSLEYPISRFGYTFTGWKITTGTGTTEIAATEKSYTISFGDITEEDGIKTINIEAQWEKASYPLRLSVVTTKVADDDLLVNLDGTEDGWMTLSEITSHEGYNTKFYWDAAQKYFSFPQNILYGESLSECFTRLQLAVPTLKDASGKQQFNSWATVNGTVITGESRFEYVPGSMLDSRGDMTLDEYSDFLNANPLSPIPAFGNKEYDVTVSKVEGWDVFVGGAQLNTETDTYSFKLVAGAKVTLRTAPANAVNASLWNIKRTSTGEKEYFAEQPYVPGSTYVYYEFTMPEDSVNASYVNYDGDESYYFDISKAPITMAENVSFNGFARNGFWYKHIDKDIPYTPLFAKVGGSYIAMSALTGDETVEGYFYAWNSDKLYITSNNVATKNQLTLINTITVYLQNCNLIATDAYTSDAVGTKLGDKELDRANANGFTHSNTGKYGNIVVDNTAHNSYTVTMVINGENTISGIFQSNVNAEDSFTTILNINGSGTENSILNLGSNYGNFITTIKNTFVKGKTGDKFKYIFYAPNEKLQRSKLELVNSEMKATEKRVYTALGSVFARDSKFDIESTYIGYWFELYGASYTRIRGDYGGVYFGFKLYGSSSAVVDGNMITTGTWYESNQTISTDGYLVVKGYMRAGHITMSKGTLIANTIEMDYKADITGGTIITNQFINSPVGDIPAVGYSKPREEDSAIWDNVPFPTYATSREINERLYNFKGTSKIYLFGFYKVNDRGNFDLNGTLTGEGNRMIYWISGLLDENGDLKSSTEIANFLTDDKLKADIASVANAANECIAIGNSNEDEGVAASMITRVKIGGTASIYAAGSLTFFNETTIEGSAVVHCYGNLGSNRDLIICENAKVTAKTIGNTSALTHRDNDGTYRWQMLNIKGGTISEESLGAVNQNARSTILIEGNPTFANSSVSVIRDIRINYVYDEGEFNGPEQKYDNIRVTGTWSGGTFTVSTEAKFFAAISSTSVGTANWAYDSLTGEIVTKVNANCELDDSSKTKVYTVNKISLYAVKDQYSLTVKEGFDDLTEVYIGTASVEKNQTIAVNKMSEVTLHISNKAMADKTVVWYWDANGILHNVKPTLNSTDGTVRFIMPSSPVEVFITNQIELDLYKYPITLTENGFAVDESTDGTLANIRDDAIFEYKGNILITQSSIDNIELNKDNIGNATADYNQLTVYSKPGYATASTVYGITIIANNTQRTVTLNKIYQDRIKNTYGIYAFNGADINILVSGAIRIDAIGTQKSSSKVIISGANGHLFTKDSVESDIVGKDAIFVFSYAKQYDSSSIAAANIQISNLVLLKSNNGEMFSGSNVTLNNLYISMTSYNGPVLTKKLDSLTLNDCAVYCTTQSSNAGLLFANVVTAIFTNCKVEFSYGGTVTASAPIGHANKLELVNTQWEAIRRTSTTNSTYLERNPGSTSIPGELIMTGNSSIRSEYRLQLLKLIMSDSSSITVHKPANYAYDSFLLCKDITMSGNAVITADYVIISAFVEKAEGDRGTYSTFLEWMERGKYINGSGTLTMNGGTINAAKAIGGAYGSKIEVKGGTVNAYAVGTLTDIYGYTTVIPGAGEKFVYSYALKPHQLNSTVEITGGKVNISENGYLGGHNSTVTITGGEVALANGAVIGITATQRTDAVNDATSNGLNPAEKINVSVAISGGAEITGEGASILAPYGNIYVSGANTYVKVNNIIADFGTVTVENSIGKYSVTLIGHTPVGAAGVYVNTKLSAMNIEITGGALVYADRAEVVIPEGETTKLTVAAGAYLYTQAYGASGLGANENSIDAYKTGDERNIFSARVIVSVTYIENLTSDDPNLTTNNTNPTQYDQTVNQYLTIEEIARYCYDFAGWYANPEFAGEPITQLNMSSTRPVVLYAKWTPKVIKFQVIVDSSSQVPTMEKSTDGLAGTLEGGVFTFTRVYELAYGTQLQGGTGIHLTDHALNDYNFSLMEVADVNFVGANKAIDTETLITRDYVEAFVNSNGAPIKLRVLSSQKKRQEIAFHIGQGTTAPKYAELADGYVGSTYIDFNKTIESGFTVNGETISAEAPGYTFVGWATSPDATEPDINFNEQITTDTPTEYYVIWKANEYVLEFDAADSDAQITDDENEPISDEPDKLRVTVTYDEKIDGNINVDGTPIAGVPYAWNKGYKFVHWVVSDGTTEVILEKTGSELILNIDDFEMLKAAFGMKSKSRAGGAQTPVLTFKAVYEEVRVTYVDGGAHWVSPAMSKDDNGNYFDKPAYGTALKGYTAVATPTAGYETFCSLNGYAVYSTTAAKYQESGFAGITSMACDYRNTLYNKGHTFYGWFDSEANAKAAAIGTGSVTTGAVNMTPEYEDITVYAAWHSNEYDLVLNATGNITYDSNTKFSNSYTNVDGIPNGSGTPPTVNVLVDAKLENGDIVKVDNWPAGAAESGGWFTYTGIDGESGENNRFLLGFTFVPLDPGNRTEACKEAYELYALNVTKMINDGTLLQKGESEFFIPDEYSVLGQNTIDIPDYPNGCTIQMYAVYRERSLVFIEYYVDIDGSVVQTEKAALPCNDYSDYPTKYVEPSTIKGLGYSLVGWYFHNPAIIPENIYPDNEADYAAKLETLKSVAVYDIKVYTVYAAQVTKDEFYMDADENPTANRTTSSYSFRYTLPASMQSGNMKYTVDAPGLHFVTKDVLDAHKFEINWSGSGYEGYTSDNAVAVKISLYDNTGAERYTGWLANGEFTFDNSLPVSKYWVIQLDLYHSEVMTTAAQKAFDIKFAFVGDALAQQWIKFEGVDINLTPSKYTVIYEASLPEDGDKLTFTNKNGFTSEDNYVITENVPVGGMLHGVPTIEGYTNIDMWYNGGTDYGAPESGTLNVLTADNATNGIRLTTKWNVQLYNLTADEKTMASWNISYTLPAYSDTVANKPTAGQSFTGSGAVNYTTLPYHATVKLTAKTGEPYKEFIRVNGTRLDDSSITDNSVLATDDVSVIYRDVETLYLENGTINIDTGKYQQGENADVVWRGHYDILMDEDNNADNSTIANTLNLKGDLRGRTIRLGNLNVTADNSIALDATAKVNLSMYQSGTVIALNNIYVSYGAELEIAGGSFILKPSVGYAGIGGAVSATAANGKITLENGIYNLQLPADGEAAGIGSATSAAAGDVITISDCNITAAQAYDVSTEYRGTWIGGKNVSEVTLTGSTLNQGNGSAEPFNSFAIIAKDITIDACQIGLSAAIGSPIAATGTLKIQNGSEIVQYITVAIQNLPIGYESGKIEISASDVTIDRDNPWKGYTDGKLYGGKLTIDDATSNVVIDGMRLIELGNGNVTITSAGYTQGSANNQHTGDYVLLGNKPFTGTVVGTTGDITLRLDTQSEPISIADITFNGTLTVTGNTVNGSTNSAVDITLADGLTGTGDLTLEKVNVTAAGKEVGSAGATDGSNATTTVTITGSAVTADTVGALGAHNKTFTLVVLEGISSIVGKLVRDHYRLEYKDVGGVDISAYDVAFRTEQPYGGVETSVGVDLNTNRPTGAETWYYKEGNTVIALSNSEVSGYDDFGSLNSALVNTAEGKTENGATTIYIYLDMKVEVTVTAKGDRYFASFTGGTQNVTIPANGTFTALVKFTGVNVVGGSYVLKFASALPAGTRLGLTLLKENNVSDYYYYVADGTEKEISLDLFEKMGDANGTNPVFFTAENVGIGHTDEMLISFDFSGNSASADNVTVEPTFVVGACEDKGESFEYTLNDVDNGSVTATENKITVEVPTVSVFEGKIYALVAEFEGINLPYNAAVTLDSVKGEAFGGKLLFNNITAGEHTLAIYGITGEFEIKWTLVLQEADSNVMGVELAKGETQHNIEAKEPSLDITRPSIRDYEQGVAHSIAIPYSKANVADGNVKAILEKQGIFGNFDETDITVTVTEGNVSVELPATLEKGVYRIAVSLNGESFEDCDNVYYTFIIH